MRLESLARPIGVLLVLAGVSCADRQVPSDEEPPRIRCSWIAAYVYPEDGPRVRVQDSETGDAHTKVCTCSTVEEFLDPEYRASINELAYEECLDFVTREGYDPEMSSCHEDYVEGQWAGVYGVAEHDFDGLPELCDEMPSGCGVE